MTGNSPVRVLVVDDEPRIIEDYRYVLGDSPERKTDKIFKELEEDLFGSSPRHRMFPEIELSTFQEGSAGVEAVREALRDGHPYAIAFLDMRMPLGISGLETAEQIRELDPYIQIVIVTAYSDVHPYDITERVPPADRLSFLLKPFHSYEIQQLAASLSAKWRGTRKINQTYEELSHRDRDTGEVALVETASPAEASVSRDAAPDMPVIGVLRFNTASELVSANQGAIEILDASGGWLSPGKSWEQIQWSIAGRILSDEDDRDPTAWVQTRIDDPVAREDLSRMACKDGRTLLITERVAPNGNRLSFYVDVSNLEGDGDRAEARIMGSLLGILCEEIETRRDTVGGLANKADGAGAQLLAEGEEEPQEINAGESDGKARLRILAE